jgi:hypothetical protein
MSSSLFVIFLLLSLLQPSNSTYEPSGPPAGPVRKRDAAEVIPLFVGRYLVTDSRLNDLNVSSVEFLLENEVPTLRFNAADGTLLTTLQANVCSGDLLNKHTGNMYLSCNVSEHVTTYPHYFLFRRVASDYIKESGRFLEYSPMPVSDGVLLDYQMKIEGLLITRSRPLALRRIEPQ